MTLEIHPVLAIFIASIVTFLVWKAMESKRWRP